MLDPVSPVILEVVDLSMSPASAVTDHSLPTSLVVSARSVIRPIRTVSSSLSLDRLDSETDLLTATIQFADALCQGNGVTNLPTAATCAPGAQSTTAGASAASSSASLSGTAAAAVSSASSVAAPNSTSSHSGAAAGSNTASTTVLTGTASSAAASASASATKNAANKAAAGVGALLFGALAAL